MKKLAKSIKTEDEKYKGPSFMNAPDIRISPRSAKARAIMGTSKGAIGITGVSGVTGATEATGIAGSIGILSLTDFMANYKKRTEKKAEKVKGELDKLFSRSPPKIRPEM